MDEADSCKRYGLDVDFIRWLEKHDFGNYFRNFANLDILSLAVLYKLTHIQLIELCRQCEMMRIEQVQFSNLITQNNAYEKRNTININNFPADTRIAYEVVSLTERIKSMGVGDNWDECVEDIKTLIDDCARGSPNIEDGKDEKKLDPTNSDGIQTMVECVEECLQLDKNNYVSWDLQGLLHARKKFFADARVCFQRSLVTNPNYLHARFNHARLLHYELKKHSQAKQEYEVIIRNKPNFSRAYNAFAKLYEEMEDYENCEKYYRAAIKLRPKSISYRHALASILSKQNRHVQVQQVYQNAVQQHPRSGTLRFHHALSLVKCKYYDAAEIEFGHALKIKPTAPIFHEYGKFCERHRKPPDFGKAIDLYFKACKLDPIGCMEAAVDAANLMRRLDTKESKESSGRLFLKLLSDAPHLASAWLGYSKLLVRDERYTEADDILKKALKKHRGNPDLEDYYKYFTTLMRDKVQNIIQQRPSVLYEMRNSGMTKSGNTYQQRKSVPVKHVESTSLAPNKYASVKFNKKTMGIDTSSMANAFVHKYEQVGLDGYHQPKNRSMDSLEYSLVGRDSVSIAPKQSGLVKESYIEVLDEEKELADGTELGGNNHVSSGSTGGDFKNLRRYTTRDSNSMSSKGNEDLMQVLNPRNIKHASSASNGSNSGGGYGGGGGGKRTSITAPRTSKQFDPEYMKQKRKSKNLQTSLPMPIQNNSSSNNNINSGGSKGTSKKRVSSGKERLNIIESEKYKHIQKNKNNKANVEEKKDEEGCMVM